MTERCETLQDVRRHIDRLDRQIVALLAERAGYVNQAARFKTTRADVVVPSRIEEIILRVRALAETHRTDPDLLEEIYRAMIAAFIRHEGKVWDELHKS